MKCHRLQSYKSVLSRWHSERLHFSRARWKSPSPTLPPVDRECYENKSTLTSIWLLHQNGEKIGNCHIFRLSHRGVPALFYVKMYFLQHRLSSTFACVWDDILVYCILSHLYSYRCFSNTRTWLRALGNLVALLFPTKQPGYSPCCNTNAFSLWKFRCIVWGDPPCICCLTLI